MPVLAPPDPHAVRQSPGLATEPVLRLRRRDGSVVQATPLPAGKCTIGSSSQCHICLPDADVRPLQCVILTDTADGAATAVRWAAGVRLNGRDFSKSPLADGDTLSMGGWEIEFLYSGQTESAAEDAPSAFEAEAWEEPAANDGRAGEPHVDPTTAFPGGELVDGVEAPGEAANSPAAALASLDAGCEPTSQAPNDPDAGATVPVLDGPKPEIPARSKANLSGRAYADGLILRLWQANFSARRRVKSLIAAVRGARFDAEARSADFAAISQELNLVRAAYEAQAEHREQLKRQIQSDRTLSDERITALDQELIACRAQVAAAQAALDAETIRVNELTAQLADYHLQRQRLEDAEAGQQRVAALEASLDEQLAEVQRITGELQRLAAEHAQLGELYRGEQQRADDLRQLLESERQRHEAFSSAESLPGEVDELAEPTDDPGGPSGDESAAFAEPADATIAWPADRAADYQEPVATPVDEGFTVAAEGSPVVQPEEGAQAPERRNDTVVWPPANDGSLSGEQPPMASTGEDAQADRAGTPDSTAASADLEDNQLGGTDSAASSEWDVERLAAPALVAGEEPGLGATPLAALPRPATEAQAGYASVSFIEKYRHLLDEEGQPPLDPGAAAVAVQSVLEDEFLSPATVAHASPADDSDEALEVYMANLMKRVCGGSPLQPPAAASSMDHPAEPPVASPESPPLATEASEPLPPLDIESLRQASRKAPLTSDLNALREIANKSARTALASHSERRQYESAVSRISVAVIASAAAAFLMASAPALNDPQLWGGAASGLIGLTAAVQVIALERRRQAERSARNALVEPYDGGLKSTHDARD